MIKLLCRYTFLFILIAPAVFWTPQSVSGQRVQDTIEGEEGDESDATVESDADVSVDTDDIIEPGIQPPTGEAAETVDDKATEAEEKPLKPSPDAKTHFLFVKPARQEFIAGRPVRLLVGFTNVGKGNFVVETMDASFRYPQDYSYYIHNFTTIRYNQLVEPAKQATFEYGFVPSESLSARPFGLTINLNYRDMEDNYFLDAIFNETITILEIEEGLDGETFFLYIFLAAVVVLIFFGVHHLLKTFGKKKLLKSKPVVEMGTQNNKGDVDYDWLPKETLNSHNRPKQSPRQSARERRTKRSTGHSDND